MSKKSGSTGVLDPLPIPQQQKTNSPLAPKSASSKSAKVQTPKPLLSRYESFLIPALVLFMLGNALAYALPGLLFTQLTVGLSIMGVLVGLIFYTAGQPQSRWKIRLSLWAIFLIAGSIFYQQFHFKPAADDVSKLAPLDRAEVMGTVESLTGAHRAVIRVSTINGRPATGQVLATIPQSNAPDELDAGTRILMIADLRHPFHSSIPGAFDQEKYLASQQITALLKHPERLVFFETSNAPNYILQRTTDRLKTKIAATFAQYLPSPQAEVLGGIVLGDKAIPVDKDVRQAFIQTGLVHILAASGLNVGIIAAAVLWLLTRLRWNFHTKLLAAMGAVAFYSLLTGLPPSIQRAATMLEIALFLKLMNRSLSPTLLLCVAGSILLLLHPDHIGSIGFQFSMLTTFGLVTMVPPLQEKLGYYITRGLASVLLVPVIAQLWVWPLSVFYFNQFPIHAVPLNILALLLVTPLTILGFSAAAISVMIPVIGGLFGWLSIPFLNGLLLLVQWGDGMSWAKWTLPSPSPTMLVLLYLQLFVILGLLTTFKKIPLIQKALIGTVPLFVMLSMLCAQKNAAYQETQISLLPLSFQHEGYLLKPAKQNQYLAVLPANLNYFETRAVADYLKHRNISAVEALVLLPQAETNDLEKSVYTSLKPLKNILIPTILTTPEVANILEVPSKTKVVSVKGADMQLGQLSVHAEFPKLQIISSHYCLLEITDQYQATSKCGLQVTQESENILRFFSTVKLDPKLYYELHQQDERMQLLR